MTGAVREGGSGLDACSWLAGWPVCRVSSRGGGPCCHAGGWGRAGSGRVCGRAATPPFWADDCALELVEGALRCQGDQCWGRGPVGCGAAEGAEL